MAYRGLVQKFEINRPLNEGERTYQLKQDVRLSVEPQARASVIEINSSYLEITDKWFAWKGALSIFMLGIIAAFMTMYGLFVYYAATRPAGSVNDDTLALVGSAIIVFPLVAVMIWLLRKESFAYTHYPIRFDRKNRRVHVFRPDGTVLSARWDKIFFTLGRLNQRLEWEVRGHILAADGNTVVETFALSHAEHIGDIRISPGQVVFTDSVRAHWEFVRRYMQDGLDAVAHVVENPVPINTRKETAGESMRRIFLNNAEEPQWLSRFLILPSLPSVVGRRFAMTTSKIPRWPKQIELR
jgi:hypothetical protein